ncbi:MAG TPA: hypothetical protein VNG12_10810 [Acidimicrobiales bacterium]|nr:hypothetical protein [Acidimicrobiales bacterium]
MARSHARIKTAIWSDPQFLALSSGAQRLYHLLLEQPTMTMCGVLALTVGRWASMAPDTTPKVIRNQLVELAGEKHGRFVIVDEATEEVSARTFAKHDINWRVPNTVVAVSKDFCAIRSEPIRHGFVQQLPDEFVERYVEGLPDGLAERLAKPFRLAMEEGFLTRVHAGVPPPATTAFVSTTTSTPK